ncbi:MAG TPA: VC0807 family protein [Ktedonobacterales bacterium]|nr:VC0807 family protein [Ktedonobacterales bacterium]
MITIALHGYEGVNPALEFGPLQAAFEQQGFACRIIRSPRTRTKTPNQVRAKVMIEALREVEGDIVLVGISNQGLFMPLVAAARPIRRIVMLNAVIPFPGQTFLHGSQHQHVWANWLTSMFAHRAPGMNEVCPLAGVPQTDYVYICGERDDAIRPEWEQWAAREYLHVEPVVIPRAAHGDIVFPPYASQVVAAATRGLQVGAEAPAAAHTTATGAWTTERPGQPGPARSGPASSGATPQRGRQGYRVISIVISLLTPLIGYFAIRSHVSGDTEALALAWFIPVAWTLLSSLMQRRLDVFCMLGVVAYGITLTISIVSGAGALPLKLHHALVGGAIGLVCLGSVAIGKPVFVVLLQRRAQMTGRGAQVEAGLIQAALTNPRLIKLLTNLTLLVGAGALADGVLQTALAITLTTSAFLVATTIIHVAIIVGVAVTLLVALWVRAGRAI